MSFDINKSIAEIHALNMADESGHPKNTPEWCEFYMIAYQEKLKELKEPEFEFTYE